MTMLKVHSIETFGVHDGPGIRLVVFLQGCPFRCVFCSNPDTQPADNPKSYSMTAKQIIDRLERSRPYFKDNGGITFSGGEPTMQAKALIEVMKAIKKAGFHITIDTCGGIHSAESRKVYDLTDLVLLDVKHIDPTWHQKITGMSNENVLANAAYREQSGKPMWLKYVLVRGWSDQPEYLEAWAKYFKDYKTVQRVEILPYHTLGMYKYEQLGLPYALKGVEPTTQEEAEKARQIFAQYLGEKVVIH